MKIVLSNYRFFVSGGPERYMFTIQRALTAGGHQIFPFSVRSNRNEPTDYERLFMSPVADDDSAYFSEYKRDFRTLSKVLIRQVYSPEGFFKARAFADLCKPDLVYSLQFMSKMSPSVLDGFKSKKLPVVLRVSDFSMICPQGHLFDGEMVCKACIGGNFLHAAHKRCVMGSRAAALVKGGALMVHRLLRCRDRIDAYVFPSRSTLQLFVEAGFPEEKLHYVPTPVNADDITPEYHENGPFLYFGRVVIEKGVHHLLAAYRELPANCRPPLEIIGAQAEVPFAKTLMNEYKEASFRAFATKQELVGHISKSICVIIPSVWYDNLPNVLLESYAYGKPVIAPRHGCFTDLIEDGKTGLLYAPGSPEALREKLAWAMEHPAEMAQMGRNARTLVETAFSLPIHLEQLMKVFEAVA